MVRRCCPWNVGVRLANPAIFVRANTSFVPHVARARTHSYRGQSIFIWCWSTAWAATSQTTSRSTSG
jgi:hypothetical protein